MMDESLAKDQEQTHEIVITRDYNGQLRDFERGFLNFLTQLNLPADTIFVSVNERLRVFNNIEPPFL